MRNILNLEKLALESFRPPERLSLSEWADRNAFLQQNQVPRVEGGAPCHIKKGLWMRSLIQRLNK